MKPIILYKSKYGATQQYAQWLSARSGIEAREISHADLPTLVASDTVLIGSSVYVGKMLVSKWLKQHGAILQNKKLIFFIVCATPAAEKEKTQEIADNSIPAILRKNALIHFLPGRMILERLSWIDRLLMKMGAAVTKDPAQKARMSMNFDEVKEENLSGILMALNAKKDPTQSGSYHQP